ncbi:MAG: 5'/3'-nucleotidase SurE [Puniceicoccaceae bacterium]
MEKHILITNDDGIESGFLHAIAGALAKRFRITIAAPGSEQSWIGRAVSRRGGVPVQKHAELPWPAWTIGGTPTDCVNIAMANLLEERPDAVVSGINIGYNTTTQLIYCSGTVAGALEGAFWGLPAFAVSLEIPDTIFWEVSQAKGRMPEGWQSLLDDSAEHAAGLVAELLEKEKTSTGNGDAVVHNLNYPSRPENPFRILRTIPAHLREMGFFQSDGNGEYNFHFTHGKMRPSEQITDREALAKGAVSHSILNFSALGRDLNH